MPEWLKDLIVAVGGGTVVLVGVLTIFKKLLVKLFETGIESSFEKSLEKYRNTLSRSSKAYEILLEREMRFYERIEPIFAELVPLEHDLLYCVKHDDRLDWDTESECFIDCFKRYGDLIKVLKSETLIHQSYIPLPISVSSMDVVAQMQKDLKFWSNAGKQLFAREYEQINYEEGQATVDAFFALIVTLQLKIKKRLEELSKVS